MSESEKIKISKS